MKRKSKSLITLIALLVFALPVFADQEEPEVDVMYLGADNNVELDMEDINAQANDYDKRFSSKNINSIYMEFGHQYQYTESYHPYIQNSKSYYDHLK